MGDLGFKIRGQIYDADGAKGTALRADTASDAQALRDKCDLRVIRDFNTEFSTADNWAGFFALLSALLGLAFVRRDDGDSGEFVTHFGGSSSKILLGRSG